MKLLDSAWNLIYLFILNVWVHVIQNVCLNLTSKCNILLLYSLSDVTFIPGAKKSDERSLYSLVNYWIRVLHHSLNGFWMLCLWGFKSQMYLISVLCATFSLTFNILCTAEVAWNVHRAVHQTDVFLPSCQVVKRALELNDWLFYLYVSRCNIEQ